MSTLNSWFKGSADLIDLQARSLIFCVEDGDNEHGSANWQDYYGDNVSDIWRVRVLDDGTAVTYCVDE